MVIKVPNSYTYNVPSTEEKFKVMNLLLAWQTFSKQHREENVLSQPWGSKCGQWGPVALPLTSQLLSCDNCLLCSSSFPCYPSETCMVVFILYSPGGQRSSGPSDLEARLRIETESSEVIYQVSATVTSASCHRLATWDFLRGCFFPSWWASGSALSSGPSDNSLPAS